MVGILSGYTFEKGSRNDILGGSFGCMGLIRL